MPVASGIALSPDPFLVGVVVATTAGGSCVLSRSAAAHMPWRWASLALSAILLGAALLSPVATLGAHSLLTAHLLQVLVVMGGTPPLLLLALKGCGGEPRGASRLRHVARPIWALLLVNGTFFAWHATGLFDLSLRYQWLYSLATITLLLTSLAFWGPIIADHEGERAMSDPLKLGYILLATIPQTFAGLMYALSHRVFYGTYAAVSPRPWGISALTDQQVAGACLALVGKISLFVAFTVVFFRLVSPSSDTDIEEGDDEGGTRPQDEPSPLPSGMPAWVRSEQTAEEPSLIRRCMTKRAQEATPFGEDEWMHPAHVFWREP